MIGIQTLDDLVVAQWCLDEMRRRGSRKFRLQLDRRPDGVLKLATLDVLIEIKSDRPRHRLVGRARGQDPVQGELANVLIISKRTDEVHQISTDYEAQGIHFVGVYFIGIIGARPVLGSNSAPAQ